MAYQKQVWREYDDTKTELQNALNGALATPERLNHIENGIANSADKAEVNTLLQQIQGIKADKTNVRESTTHKPIDVDEMNTRTKALFTGGAVAVVGVNAVGSENIKKHTVKPNQTTFIDNEPELNIEQGTITNGLKVDTEDTWRIRTGAMINNPHGLVIERKSDYFTYALWFYKGGVWTGQGSGWLDKQQHVVEPGYDVMVNFSHKGGNLFTPENIANMPSDFVITQNFKGANGYDVERILSEQDVAEAISSIQVEYGRKNGASYVFARIPKTLNNGKRISPKVNLTSVDKSMDGAKRSALTFARDTNAIFTINGGLAHGANATPVGQLIIDGESINDEPMDGGGGTLHPAQCPPLAIDANGNMTTYPRNVTNSTMLADGVQHAVTAWIRLVDNYVVSTDVTNEIELVHNGIRNPLQSIGQFQNGDYFVCTVDGNRGGIVNEAGMLYSELANLLVSKGVKFAYCLDGGGSTETVIGKRQLNPIYEGVNGRKVGTVITFEIKEEV